MERQIYRRQSRSGGCTLILEMRPNTRLIFGQVEQDLLFSLILASNYLNVPDLL